MKLLALLTVALLSSATAAYSQQRAERPRPPSISVSGEAYSEEGITVEQLLDHIWKLPKAKRKSI